ncbi:MAG TPA: carboxypeptidase regulatory-like domain-containing protein [Candidatus Sulfotelmatobacter sp.]|nr:carboxypeptidase regulatory-like domain-containing protein [Candidatus Sulfotelmatobacter sp.]
MPKDFPVRRILFPITVSLISCFGIVFGAPSFAQELGTGIISGEVSDSQSAVVRNAQVTVVQKNTGLSRKTMTNSAGLFAINNLAPGPYELRVTAGSFADYLTSIVLEVGQQTNVKVHLGVQKQQTVIDINDLDSVPLVDTASSVVDGVINSQQIENLPLNGRNFLELALLTPGNTIAPNFDPTKQGTVVISSAGQLGRGGNVSIDGMDDNDDVVGGMLLNVPEDAVQEFQVATNRFSAEMGRTGSAVANVVTKSGSNTLHGSASIYERDKSLQAATPIFNPTGGFSAPENQSPQFRRQQYSGTVGGPLIRDKAWWFGAFEYRDEIGGVVVGTRNLATQHIDTGFASVPLTDPMGTVRGDWNISQKDTLSLHYSIERLNATGAASFLSGQPIGSASERQNLNNDFQTFQASWTRTISPTLLNRASYAFNNFINSTSPIAAAPELDFPSLADGSSYRVPQQTRQKRSQFDDNLDWTRGRHNFHFGGEFQRVGADFNLGVFQSGVIEFVQDFANQDRNGDGVINDQDLLFAVAIRSGIPATSLVIPNADNNYTAGYFQDDWRVHPQLVLNLGLRYEIDSDVNDLGHYDQLNPIVLPFLHGTRHKAANNWGPRIGFNWSTKDALISVHGGYGIYYDRITLEIDSLERGLNGTALPINVSLGSANFLDGNGNFIPGLTPEYPGTAFDGPIIPGAGGAAEGINIIDNNMRNPMVQQFNLGVEYSFAKNWVLKLDGIHDLGTHFIIGVPVGSVFNPASGGPETVTDLQSSVNTHYDALWAVVDHRFSNHFQFHSAYTFSKALNYANYDQIPFGYAPVDPTNLRREYGFAPNDQTHRLVLQGTADLPFHLRLSPLWTYGSGVPMDILLGDGSGDRVPGLSRNAGGRQFRTGAELNAFLTQLNVEGALNGSLGTPLPMVSPDVRFNDTFNSFDLRLAREFHLGERFHLQAFGEVFNLFNKTNVLGSSNANYSGFFNVLVPDRNNPNLASDFGRPASGAGGVFGSGGPRAFQLAVKLAF